jgi:hypothetical protein
MSAMTICRRHRRRTPIPTTFASGPLLDTAAAAEHLGVSPSYLAKLRMKGTGPEYSKLDKLVRYRLENLDRYELERRRTSTAEEPRVIGPVRNLRKRKEV